jgi:hypothetical protein
MNHTSTTKNVAIALIGVVASMTAVLIGVGAIGMLGYLQEVKAAIKTHSLSTSMSTDCNGETNETCQTTLCENDKPCHTVDSNSAQRNITIVCKDDNSCRTITNTP